MTTARDALLAHYAANGMEADPAQVSSWVCRIGPMSIRFPNWDWRRKTITRHDLHHILTGYPCTMTGEMQMAAWEFAAGRYRHWAATLFCMPLVLLGLLCAPCRTAKAFRDGLASRSLYSLELDLSMPLKTVRALTVKQTAPSPVTR